MDFPALHPRLCLRALLAASATLGAGHCLANAQTPVNFVDLSLEELSDFRITSVSRKEERLADAAASIQVLTADAIRRAGARTLPEALRLASNLQVARINASSYAISARGSNTTTANKLLVMIDGRTVYTPLYSGVFWDAQDVLLADIDRIEVVSGPGGTLWGTNAVNGVINIITRRAQAADGDLAQLGGGQAGLGTAYRHSGALGGGGAYRVYAKADRERRSATLAGPRARDEQVRAQAGFRADWRDGGDGMSLLGDLYRDGAQQQPTAQQPAPGRVRLSGANLVARWERATADGGSWHVQGYLDRTEREIPGTFAQQLNTLDLDLQYSQPELNGRQRTFGGGYRLANDRVTNSAALAFLPARRQLRWANLFAQQEQDLPNNMRLTLGLRLESNIYTGVEWLPSMKLAWKPTAEGIWWAGLARAVRAPSRIDTEFYIPGRAPYQLAGGPDFRAELADTLELGRRASHGNALTYSLVAYHTQYRRLRSIGALPDRTLVLDNQVHGQVQGLEATVAHQVTPAWSIDAGGMLQHQSFSGGVTPQSPQGNDPRAQLTLRSKWNLDARQEWDVTLRHVGRLPSPAVPSYTVLDLHWALRLSPTMDVAVNAANLFNRRHREFASGNAARQPVNPVVFGRSVNVMLTARF
ncbi:TonB-dependent receptor plug domain-containing protein [Pseudoduganella namucuonensis]|uniref:Iron complex outermembrane recepter protein n=1 Tax=Pseudoduganella namucuonensis TaxID=1035707 RepID=A0A1I7J7V2_9BURK|nr:TonB-dependent receptor [Pseudoduganella namucuonensis]SFU81289.1 iron complex outermembrane recepter protein [Pseudoduganella namucuonensis]